MKENLKNNLKKIIHLASACLSILLCVFVCIYHSSCRATAEGISLIPSNQEYSTPKIQDVEYNEDKITVTLTEPVKVEDTFAVEHSEDVTSIDSFFAATQDDSKSKTGGNKTDEMLNAEQIASSQIEVDYNLAEDGETITFSVQEQTEIGKDYDLYACVKDQNDNTLTFTIPFCGVNKNIPEVIISEVSDYYSGKEGVTEYVELYALTSGNLFGLELISASDEKTFELPCVEVKKGEYILVHLRHDKENADEISELDKNLNLSKTQCSVLNVRDLWTGKNESVLSGTAEIIILNNKVKNCFVDCVMYCKKEYADQNEQWNSESLDLYSKRCIEQNLWSGKGSPKDAVYSEKRKTINYISRIDIDSLVAGTPLKNSSKNWIGTTKSKTTPGKPNSTVE